MNLESDVIAAGRSTLCVVGLVVLAVSLFAAESSAQESSTYSIRQASATAVAGYASSQNLETVEGDQRK